jgi:hypothetical protein
MQTIEHPAMPFSPSRNRHWAIFAAAGRTVGERAGLSSVDCRLTAAFFPAADAAMPAAGSRERARPGTLGFRNGQETQDGAARNHGIGRPGAGDDFHPISATGPTRPPATIVRTMGKIV